MTPRYCIAIARTGSKKSALAIVDKLSELEAAIIDSKADEVDIFNKGAYVKTVRPANLRAQAEALADKEKRLAKLQAPAEKPKAEKPKAEKPKPSAKAKAEAEADEPVDPLG